MTTILIILIIHVMSATDQPPLAPDSWAKVIVAMLGANKYKIKNPINPVIVITIKLDLYNCSLTLYAPKALYLDTYVDAANGAPAVATAMAILYGVYA